MISNLTCTYFSNWVRENKKHQHLQLSVCCPEKIPMDLKSLAAEEGFITWICCTMVMDPVGVVQSVKNPSAFNKSKVLQGSLYYQPKQYIIMGKSLKITIHLYCLTHPKYRTPVYEDNIDPWITWQAILWKVCPLKTFTAVLLHSAPCACDAISGSATTCSLSVATWTFTDTFSTRSSIHDGSLLKNQHCQDISPVTMLFVPTGIDWAL